MLRHAVEIQDSLKYDEPPDWFYPVRESLGAVLLLNGNAVEAEKVFQEDLGRPAQATFAVRAARRAESAEPQLRCAIRGQTFSDGLGRIQTSS